MTVPVLFLQPSFYGRGMPSSFLWGSPMWLSLVLKCFLSLKWLECTNPPSQSTPHSRTATWTSTSFLWAVNRCTAGLFPAPCPHLLLIHHRWVTTWEAEEIKLWTRYFHNFSPLTRVSLLFFSVPFLSYWLLLNSFPVECFSSLNFLHHCWISNLPIIDLLLEFRPRSTATYFTPTFSLWSLHLKGQWTAEQLSLFLADLFGVLH